MKKQSIVLSAMFFIMLVATTSLAANEIIIPFESFRGEEVGLKYDLDTKQVSLRLRTRLGENHEVRLKFLTKEALKIIRAKGKIALGDSGFSIEFQSGFPIWGPHQSWGPSGEFECLLFGEQGTLDLEKRTLTIQGQSTKPPYSWYHK